MSQVSHQSIDELTEWMADALRTAIEVDSVSIIIATVSGKPSEPPATSLLLEVPSAPPPVAVQQQQQTLRLLIRLNYRRTLKRST